MYARLGWHQVPEKAPSKDLLDKRSALKAKLQVCNSHSSDRTSHSMKRARRAHACDTGEPVFVRVGATQEKQTHLKVVIDKLRSMQNDIAVLSCAANTYDT